DNNPGSGTVTDVTVGSVSPSGQIDGGAISQVTVTGDMNGAITAAGAGTLDGITIDGSLGGSLTAVEDSNPGSGTVTDVTVGSVSPSGQIDGGAISQVTVDGDMNGAITAAGA